MCAVPSYAAQPSSKKDESGFVSGVGVLVGLGVGTASTQTQNGVSDGNYYNTPPIAIPGIVTGLDADTYIMPTTNFLSPASSVQNHTGASFMTGVLAQYVSRYGVTSGLRWIYGRTGASTTLQYPQGNLNMSGRWVPPFYVSTSFVASDSQSFSLKDSYFNAVLFELGYVLNFNFLPKYLQKFQVYVAPGFSMHHQKFSVLNAEGDISGEILSKSVPAPVFALGTRYAMSKKISLGFEWQRHMGNKKAWNQVAQIMPTNSTYGAPLMRMNNNLFMFSLTYMFGK